MKLDDDKDKDKDEDDYIGMYIAYGRCCAVRRAIYVLADKPEFAGVRDLLLAEAAELDTDIAILLDECQ